MKIDLDKISIEVEDQKVNIKINDGIQIPQTLYKYYSLSYRSVESLKNQTIHFGHAFSMNDLMDGNFLLWDFDSFLDTFMYEMQLPLNEKKICVSSYFRIFLMDFLNTLGISAFAKTIQMIYYGLIIQPRQDIVWNLTEKNY